MIKRQIWWLTDSPKWQYYAFSNLFRLINVHVSLVNNGEISSKLIRAICAGKECVLNVRTVSGGQHQKHSLHNLIVDSCDKIQSADSVAFIFHVHPRWWYLVHRSMRVCNEIHPYIRKHISGTTKSPKSTRKFPLYTNGYHFIREN